jgi:isoleucyl-tRNA synthetase
VKQVLFSAQESELVDILVKPNFPVLGPIFGKDMKACAEELKKLSESELARIEQGESIEVLGRMVPPSALSVTRTAKSGAQEIETAAGVTVFFDTKITPELQAEGFAREFVNRVQRMRKDADFAITDRIHIEYVCAEADEAMLEMNRAFVQDETLGLSMKRLDKFSSELDFQENQEIDGRNVQIGLRKVNA